MGRLPENTRRNDRGNISTHQRSDEAERTRMDIETRGMGAKQSIDDIEYAREKRDALQPEIARREQQMRRQLRRQQKIEIILTWGDSER